MDTRPEKQAEASKGSKFLASTHLHFRSAQQRETCQKVLLLLLFFSILAFLL